jgi:hypothetical protein
VARSADEAERQARGEDLTRTRTDEEDERAQAVVEGEKFFERRGKGEAEAGSRRPRSNRFACCTAAIAAVPALWSNVCRPRAVAQEGAMSGPPLWIGLSNAFFQAW